MVQKFTIRSYWENIYRTTNIFGNEIMVCDANSSPCLGKIMLLDYVTQLWVLCDTLHCFDVFLYWIWALFMCMFDTFVYLFFVYRWGVHIYTVTNIYFLTFLLMFSLIFSSLLFNIKLLTSFAWTESSLKYYIKQVIKCFLDKDFLIFCLV